MIALFLLAAALSLALAGLGLYLLLRRPRPDHSGFYPSYPKALVTVGGHAFRAAVAKTTLSRAQGLSGRRYMEEDEAMLFMLPAPMRFSFWMKDMLFPLDIIWVRRGIVVDVAENVPVPEPGASIADLAGSAVRPRSAADMVLEVRSGLALKLGIKKGDKVEIAAAG